MAAEFWSTRFDQATGKYACPTCNLPCNQQISKSAKNPGKAFVSCDDRDGKPGCGFFCFTDQLPKAGGGFKRARPSGGAAAAPVASAGTTVLGPIASAPNVVEQRLADLATQVQQLTSALAAHDAKLAQLYAFLDQ